MVDAERDGFELTLAQQALRTNLPILAICRGMQLFNIATGGNLVLHVPEVYSTTIPHRLDHPRRPIEHDTYLVADSRLTSILGATTVKVVSWHHQAVHQVVDTDWQVVAQAADGLVEAMEHRHHPWLVAVQWHPELSPWESVHSRLFQALVKAAATRNSGYALACGS